MIRFFFRSGLLAASVFLLACAIGCERPKPIRSYSIPKPEAVYEANHVDPAAPQDAEGNPLPLDDRMLTALIPHGDTAWYVKLSGPKDSVAPHVDNFQDFVKSFNYTADPASDPSWKLHPDWTSFKPNRSDPMNTNPSLYAEITIGKTSPPLDIRVTSLPLGQLDLNSYILLNVNRWRGQLSLRPTVMPVMKKEMQTIKIADGSTAYYFDMLGKLQSTGMPGGPMMGGHPPIASKPPAARPADAAQAEGIKFDTPAGWQAGPKDAFSQVALETGTGDDKVRVTFSALSAAAGELTSNVNRWRTQVDLPSQDAQAIQANTAKLEIGGSSGNYVELRGPKESIFGAIVVHDNQAWFLKLRGPKAAAEAQQTNFRELLKSIRFE